MEHIEQAGIHSGDSGTVLPPYKISYYHLNQVRRGVLLDPTDEKRQPFEFRRLGSQLVNLDELPVGPFSLVARNRRVRDGSKGFIPSEEFFLVHARSLPIPCGTTAEGIRVW